jgi:uncharacterized protein YgbK (DUF1537 family)
MPHDLLIAYFADDFTGSTDALEFLTRAGAETALFIEPPTPEQLAKYSQLDAIGVAGRTRSLSPAAMEAELRPALEALRDLQVPHVHYKVCSTFDSSPEIGSIGRVLELGREVFPCEFLPLLVGAPALGRYCVFGNLFARMGIGTQGNIHRLDRHPSISQHPITPMRESDLREHLKAQTNLSIGLVDILALSGDLSQTEAALAAELKKLPRPEVVLFDALLPEHPARIGALLSKSGTRGRPCFWVGSSAVEVALGSSWNAAGRLSPRTDWPKLEPAEPLLVLSGSCSPVTSRQIEFALQNGFAEVALDTPGLVTPSQAASAMRQAIEAAVALLKQKRNVVLHTSRGESDPRVKATQIANANVASLGTLLGEIARAVLAAANVRRICFAGGDTSSHAARALGIESVQMLAPLVPGAPICRVSAPGSPIDNHEVNFKGGQVGGEDYFRLVAQGQK